MECTVYKTAEFIGKKWTILILLELYKGGGSRRYSEIKKNIEEISPKILSSRLKELEYEKMIKRRVDTGERSIKCFYSLTKSGQDFIRIIKSIKLWALKWNVDNKLCKSLNCKNCN